MRTTKYKNRLNVQKVVGSLVTVGSRDKGVLKPGQAPFTAYISPRELVRLQITRQKICTYLAHFESLCGLSQGLIRVRYVPKHGRFEDRHRFTHCLVTLLGFRFDEPLEVFILRTLKRICLMQHLTIQSLILTTLNVLMYKRIKVSLLHHVGTKRGRFSCASGLSLIAKSSHAIVKHSLVALTNCRVSQVCFHLWLRVRRWDKRHFRRCDAPKCSASIVQAQPALLLELFYLKLLVDGSWAWFWLFELL